MGRGDFLAVAEGRVTRFQAAYVSREEIERGVGEMEGGGWKMENGGWRMENGEWRVESGD